MFGFYGYLLDQATVALLSVACMGIAWFTRSVAMKRLTGSDAGARSWLVDLIGALALVAAIAKLWIGRFAIVGGAFWTLAVWIPLRVTLDRRQTHVSWRLLAMTPAIVATYAVFIEPVMLDVDRRSIDVAELDGHEPLRVVHVSDTQLIRYGAREQSLVDAINAFEPHAVVFTGDYITAFRDDRYAVTCIRRLLGSIRAQYGIFATSSDSDSFEQQRRIFAGFGNVTYRVNGFGEFEHDGVNIRIGLLSHQWPRPALTATGVAPEDLFLVGCHRPALQTLVEERIPAADMFLAGHTHGGQVQIPFWGPIITLSPVPNHIAAGGVFVSESGMPFTVTRGVGTEGRWCPRIRFWCRPHVFLLTLH